MDRYTAAYISAIESRASIKLFFYGLIVGFPLGCLITYLALNLI